MYLASLERTMEHIIQLLPDAIANQIAAGEVVQRPASVVKELLENAIDAGASKVDVLVKNAGKTLIQISDDGCGMSAQDARMCFERHATSKIRQAEDLFGIKTLGFRGEALASIAAVAQVRLCSRLHSEEIGTEIEIAGSEIKKQQACAAQAGSTFYIKNLFFNVPARRNFLKSNPVEMRHIINEFLRVAIPNPHIHFTLTHNDIPVYQLNPVSLKDRLIQIFGKELKGKLIALEESTGYVKISGFVAKADVYRKNRGEQFFFVNGRYIRSHYLHHAISTAFQDFIPDKKHPVYCIFLELDPVHVDINIHPTKTEVKFDDESTIYVLLHSIVKRMLGEIDQAPIFDFGKTDIHKAIYNSPSTGQNELTVGAFRPSTGSSNVSNPSVSKSNIPKRQNWEEFYQPLKEEKEVLLPQTQKADLFEQSKRKMPQDEINSFYVRFQQGYILTQHSTHLYIVHQQLAHQRILYERFLHTQERGAISSQQLLFPQTVELSPVDFQAFKEVEPTLVKMGFEVKEFGTNTIIVYGTPPEIPTARIRDIVEQIVSDIREIGKTQFYEKIYEGIARAVAMRSAINTRQKLNETEMKKLVQDLFRCEVPAYAPTGKPTYKQLSSVELEKYFG